MVAVPHRSWSTRLVVRHIGELQIARIIRWTALVAHDRKFGLVFETILSANIAHRGWRNPETGAWIGIAEAGRAARPTSAAAIAGSMGLAGTTVRRNVAALIDAGLIERSPLGYSVTPGFFSDGRLAAVCAADAADLGRMLAVIASAGYAAAEGASEAVAALPAGVIERLLLAFALRTMETMIDVYGDVASGTIVPTIIAANVRHITNDPALSRQYAAEDAPPPDAARRPISVRALSRALEMPFETVRRRLAALVAADIVVIQAGGVVVPTRVLMSEQQIDNNRRILLHFDQMVQSISSLAGQAKG